MHFLTVFFPFRSFSISSDVLSAQLALSSTCCGELHMLSFLFVLFCFDFWLFLFKHSLFFFTQTVNSSSREMLTLLRSHGLFAAAKVPIAFGAH